MFAHGLGIQVFPCKTLTTMTFLVGKQKHIDDPGTNNTILLHRERETLSYRKELYVYGYNYLRFQCAYDVAPGGLLVSEYHFTRLEYGIDQPEDICIKIFIKKKILKFL